MKENFSKRVQNIMKFSREEAIRLGHSYVGSEHLLLGILREGTGNSIKILESFGCNSTEIHSKIVEMIKSSGGTMTLGHIPLTRRAERILRNSFAEAVSLGAEMAEDEHLLLAILKESDGIAFEVLSAFNIDYNSIRSMVKNDQLAKTIEKQSLVAGKSTKSTTPALDHFSRDITQLASKNKLDPVIGREKEIERVAQILTRRKKNNPVLIGEPGVGKTAIIEGLAQRIIDKTVPRLLYNQRILSLDLAAMVAGTKYRGQFEERMKTIMTELETNANLILFIDELHTMVGAGGASGSLDASNMFKPALARGDIQCIGATTLDEFRKHIEKDGALERRFQKIIIDPPSVEESEQILQGLKTHYEKHHNVVFDNDAIIACVRLSDRYISDKYLPDKAIDIMDEAGARAHMLNVIVPKKIIDLEMEIEQIKAEKDLVVAEQHFEDAAKLRDKERQIQERLAGEQRLWEEKEQNNPVRIGEDQIAEVVSTVTGIPVTKVAQTESQKLLNMKAGLHRYIVGQDQAIDCLTRSIQRARAGLKSPHRPIGVFMFLGPTGVGKTELAKALAKYLFTRSEALIKLDMSEYGERFSVSRMIGAPPGYVGYEEGGELTEKVRRNPYSVILFDEIEKAHPDVYNVLLQLFDEGQLTDGLGRKVDFKNTIIIMTSNTGSKDIMSDSTIGFIESSDQMDFKSLQNKLKEHVKNQFNPEFLNRIDESIVFHPLTKADAYSIIEIQLQDVRDNLSKFDMTLTLTKRARSKLLDRGFNRDFGARYLRREIQTSIEDALSEKLLKKVFKSGDRIKIDFIKDSFIFIKNLAKPTRTKKVIDKKAQKSKKPAVKFG
ncbi:MAG: ATP-dependent Clp protease ATP-binding subunit [Candidatus Marinimicrobia bacterium]|nr:ATP-dependent Clp protease ATP-binding subunit [Candidatus Neomarinimicrobiota bacterium]